jgi:predicted nucleotidyltransferase
MIVNKVLDKIFISSAIISILRELNLRKVGITGREIARQTRLTHKTAIKALNNLEELKLVNRVIAGRAYSYNINRENYIFKNIIDPAFEVEREILSKINNEIKSILGKYSESIILFGSVSRREETIGSDFDICIVYKSGKTSIEKLISSLRDKLYIKYGITLAPFLITKADFLDRIRKKKPPVNRILIDGIHISGKTLKELRDG